MRKSGGAGTRAGSWIWAAMFSILLCMLASLVLGGPEANASKPGFCNEVSATGFIAGARGPAVQKVSLGLRTKRLSPGDTQYGRLINRGTASASYGPPYRIERYVESQWVEEPSSPRGPWRRILFLLPSHSVGRCFRFEIPAGASGAYRFVIPAKVDGVRTELRTVFQVG